MRLERVVWLLAAVLSACGGGAGPAGADAGSGADAGELPVYELKLGADLSTATTATAGTASEMVPGQALVVDTLAPVTYNATETQGGATGTGQMSVTVNAHGFTLTANASGNSPGIVAANGSGGMTLKSYCVTARGAKSFTITWTCTGTVTSSGKGIAGIDVSEGAIPICYRLLDTANGDDEPWKPDHYSYEVTAVDGHTCAGDVTDISVVAGGGEKGSPDPGGATAQATITYSVDPVY